MQSLLADLENELAQRRAKGLYRSLVPIVARRGPRVVIGGRELVNLCSNDYLGLAQDPRLVEAAQRAAETWGVGSSASRLVSGNFHLHEELERRLSRFKGTEAALIYNTGYQANLGIIATLVGEPDLILSDALNHASIVDACRLSRAKVLVYRHKDLEHLEELLKTHPGFRRKLIVTDSVFSMDGDIAPLPELLELARRYEAAVFIDEAHATGVLGKRGKGACEHFGLEPDGCLIMGTLSKALGTFGAYLASPAVVRTYLVNASRPLLYTTALPPPVVAAAMAALEIAEAETWRREVLWSRTAWFREKLRQAGFDVPGDDNTPIVPLIVGEPQAAVDLARELYQRGIFVQAMRPPTVPPGTSRLRFSLTAAHSPEELERTLTALTEAAAKLKLL